MTAALPLSTGDAPGAGARVIPLPAPRLLSGPPLGEGREPYDAHRDRLGRRPHGGEWVHDAVARSGLRGRGGAWFPTARKWQAVREHAQRRAAVVVAIVSEGEPLSRKDRTLALHRPHLIIDGALIAAETVGAREVVLYAAGERPVVHALQHAVRERRRTHDTEVRISVVTTPHRYVAGESSAVVRRVNGGAAVPDFAPPHPSESGVDGRPTLVQNAETLAHVALVARFGDAWFREVGGDDAPGTSLVTLCGDVVAGGVHEVALGTRLHDVLALGGGTRTAPRGALVGGYFGAWLGGAQLAATRLTPADVSVGCGVVGVVGAHTCGLAEAARVARYLARESAGQCGPCVHGLASIAGTMERVAQGDADRGDVLRLQRWFALTRGRGACRHPDGAVANAVSALEAFGDDLEQHLRGRPCEGAQSHSLPPPPSRRWRWR